MPWVNEFSKGHPFQISYSKLKVACQRTWAEFKHEVDNPTPVGEAGQFSKLFHALLFQQEIKDPVMEPEFNIRSKAGKEEFAQWAQSIPRYSLVQAVHHSPDWLIERIGRADLTIIQSNSWDRARRMAESVHSRRFWKEHFPRAVCEQKGEVEIEGCMLRFVPDMLVAEKGLILDLKGVRDVSDDGICKAVFDRCWDIQAALYLKGASLIEGIEFNRSVGIFVLNEEPYITVEREIPGHVLQFGWDVAQRKLREYRACMMLGEWPGHDEDVREIDWKPWMVAARERVLNVGE